MTKDLKTMANQKPFEVFIHPVNKESSHDGKKHFIKKEEAQKALESLKGKPFKASHASKEFDGTFLDAKIVTRDNGEEWVKGFGLLWSGDKEEEYDFISKNTDNLGVSYELAIPEIDEDADVITPQDFLYKAIAMTEKNDPAYIGARIVVAEKGGKETMADTVFTQEQVNRLVGDALDKFKKDYESGEILKAKNAEIEQLKASLENLTKVADESKKLKEEIATTKKSVDDLTEENKTLKEKQAQIEKERIKSIRTAKVSSWLETITDKKEKEATIERIANMQEEDFGIFTKALPAAKKPNGQDNPNNEMKDEEGELKAVNRETLEKMFVRNPNAVKKGE